MAALLFTVPTPFLQSHQSPFTFSSLLSTPSPLQRLPLARAATAPLNRKTSHRSAPEHVSEDDWSFERRMEEALNVLKLMEAQGLEPDPNLYCILLKSCAEAKNLEFGKTIHSKIIGTKFEHNVFVANNLVNFYVKCGWFRTARELFDVMPQRNAVSWTSIISMYNQLGVHQEALKLYNLMVSDPQVRPNMFTYTVVLNSCGKTRNLKVGVEIHEEIGKDGCENDGFIVTALIDMYSKCGMIESARQVFDKMGEPVVAACTAMIDGYNMNDQAKEALDLIRRVILGSNLELKLAKELGFTCMIRSCIMESAFIQGQEIHAHMIKFGYELGPQTVGSFITLYERCNKMVPAHHFFDELVVKNVELWGKMISGYVRNGMHQEALQLYFQMVCEDIEPDAYALSWALNACIGIMGLKEGREIQGRAIKAGYGAFGDSIGINLVKMYREFGLEEEVHKLTKYHRRER